MKRYEGNGMSRESRSEKCDNKEKAIRKNV